MNVDGTGAGEQLKALLNPRPVDVVAATVPLNDGVCGRIGHVAASPVVVKGRSVVKALAHAVLILPASVYGRIHVGVQYALDRLQIVLLVLQHLRAC